MLKSKKKLLHIIPYNEFIPPKNGGALRCYHLCTELATYFDVTLITLQPASDIVDTNFKNIKILNPAKPLKLDGFKAKLMNAIRYRWYMGTLKGPAEATVLDFYPVLKQLSKTETFDYVLMEHLSSIALGKAIKQFFPTALRIADQHNVDHLLYKQNYDITQPQHNQIFSLLKHQESRLYQNVDYFFACSDDDLTQFSILNQNKIKGFVVPNGTTIKSITKDKDVSHSNLMFCGTLDYQPNKNGLLWFYKKIWPELKQSIEAISLTIVGRNGHDQAYEPLKKDYQINFVGEVGDLAPYYEKSDLAIVPLLEGSGTRLKILEAMSFGVPVISTSIGAEGIDTINNTNILIADGPEFFTSSITNVLENRPKLRCLSKNGMALIETKYNWQQIINELVNNLIKNK